jgi:hypothetical protein
LSTIKAAHANRSSGVGGQIPPSFRGLPTPRGSHAQIFFVKTRFGAAKRREALGGPTFLPPRTATSEAIFIRRWRRRRAFGGRFTPGGRRAVVDSAMGHQSTKSLRDSPLRGGLPARAVTKGEIVDSGRRALS